MLGVLLLLPLGEIYANQQRYSISGYVRDILSGEELIGASVYVKELRRGTTTNVYGFYSLTIEKGSYILVVSYIGYETQEININLLADRSVNINLKPVAIQAREVEITARRTDHNVRSTEIGKLELKTEVVKEIPVVLGEVDILKTLQLLPGVQSAGEGSSGFYVRGGGADQNLILLDEAVVYNTGHLFGFFSVFNADAIKNTTLYKGGMPANYGGRLSSVVDVVMKEGNMKSYHASGGIGLISSRLMVEGPIQKDKSSFMISGRRTYIDFLISPFVKNTNFAGNGYYFYDVNAKINYRFSDKDRLFISSYFGRDVFSFKSSSGNFNVDLPWGNFTTTVRWNHLFNDKLFLNTSLIYNDYNFEFKAGTEDFNLHFFSGIKDINYKMDFGYFPGLLHKIKFGMNYIYHTFIPSSARVHSSQGFSINTDDLKEKYAHEAAFYINDNYDVNERLSIDGGLRFSLFTLAPPYTELLKDDDGNVQDTVFYRKGDKVRTHTGLEQRINLRLLINDKSSIKASYNYNYQYIHMVSNSTSTLPTDVWVPSSKLVCPQHGSQYSIGYFRNFFDNKIEASVEVYYKDMKNQIEFRDGYVEELGRELEWDFVFGTGESYGAEFFISKNYGKLTGWIGYTYSKTLRHFDDLITKTFPTKYDRTHDIAIVALYNLSKRLSFGATFIYGTGIATTLPSRRYMIENTILTEYMPRNSFRLEPYHRLDIGATLKSIKERRYQSEWSFSIYNVYNHKNVFFLYTETIGNPLDGSLEIRAKKVTLFPIIPSINWNFKF